MAEFRWRMESMSKYDTFGSYPQRSLASAEAALLTAWPSLCRYHDDLVLVGGLAVYYLTRRDIQGLPGGGNSRRGFGNLACCLRWSIRNS
jgi:hypothetical protein